MHSQVPHALTCADYFQQKTLTPQLRAPPLRTNRHRMATHAVAVALSALEATQGQNNRFFSQLSYKCYLEEVASVGDWLQICPWVIGRVAM